MHYIVTQYNIINNQSERIIAKNNTIENHNNKYRKKRLQVACLFVRLKKKTKANKWINDTQNQKMIFKGELANDEHRILHDDYLVR